MINYPVDVENTRWAAYRVSTQEVVRRNMRWPRADGGEIVGLDPDLVPLLEVREDQPAYDPATERLEAATPVVDVDANTHTQGWSVVARSQQEIDDEAEREQAKAAYLALKNGEGTQLERLVRVEKVAAHLLKAAYGEA